MKLNYHHHHHHLSMWWCSWLRHCATSRKVAGLISDGVIGIFRWHNPGCTMALGLTQPLTEMSTGNIFWGEGGRCIGLTTLHLCVPVVLKFGSLNLLEPSGPVQACSGIAFTTTICVIAWGTVLQKLIILCKKGSHPLIECWGSLNVFKRLPLSTALS